MSRIRIAGGAFAFLAVFALPAAAWAQQTSGISGTVRDTSGGVLPGVTVEAASPALIEKVRTAVTDSEGRYNIIDLRPGTYAVTFSLTSFRTVRREGIELTGGFTASINIELQLGSVEESVTVTGGSPLVDVKNTRAQTIVTEDLLASLPSATKGGESLVNIVPGMTGAADVGGTLGLYRQMGGGSQTITYRGRSSPGYTYNGMTINNTTGDGNFSFLIDSLTVQEMALQSTGISAEGTSSGFTLNVIPKEGSNEYAFMLTGLFTNSALNSSNITDALSPENSRRGRFR